ncbi:aldehyde dehydrogenase family protein [Micromonospora sp. WMMD975]|uniref:aldehyde dehydrogenase family protein n=1 Tax=Micromonospora sp. WMMD975 TaxID=3016087 RepID=UPI00249C439F|nr:aldehyde dehydrogenase family protein [Micromonospora sp. WMMD975]WFE34610.1 aldehyde dehydrogenase family protein [Micromonospora sp. WMMD975]
MALNSTATTPPTALPYLDGDVPLAQFPTSDRLPVRNPADHRELVGTVALGTAEQVDRALDLAVAAAPGWAALTAAGRAELLRAAADALDRQDTAARAMLLTREHGKVLWESTLDVGGAAAILRYYAGLAAEFDAEVDHRNAVGTARFRRRPLGVTAVIVPWNYPVYLASLMLVPALLAGNPVVVKPSEVAPLALTETLRTLAAALPAGVVTVVPGTGPVVGATLTSDRRVRAVLFTGSTATGRTIMASAAPTLKRLGLELGGNDPALVLESAVVDDRLVDELVRGTFTSSGQVCYSVKRIYAHRSRYRELVAAYLDAANALVVGDGRDPETTIGPLTTRSQYDRVRALVADARQRGAQVTTIGRRGATARWECGNFLLPTVVTDAPHDAALVAEEQFGPAIPILPFDTDDEAVALANGTDYGLAASVWTADPAHADVVARRIEAGSVFVNAHRLGASDLAMPFGGAKQSGIGRRHGFVAVEECSELQTIAHIADPAGLPGPATPTRPGRQAPPGRKEQ